MCSLIRMHRGMMNWALKELKQKIGIGMGSWAEGAAGTKASGWSTWSCQEALPSLECTAEGQFKWQPLQPTCPIPKTWHLLPSLPSLPHHGTGSALCPLWPHTLICHFFSVRFSGTDLAIRPQAPERWACVPKMPKTIQNTLLQGYAF